MSLDTLRFSLFADLTKEIGEATSSSITGALIAAVRDSCFWDKMAFLHEAMKTEVILGKMDDTV